MTDLVCSDILRRIDVPRIKCRRCSFDVALLPLFIQRFIHLECQHYSNDVIHRHFNVLVTPSTFNDFACVSKVGMSHQQSTKRQKQRHDNDKHPKDPKMKHDMFARANIISSLRDNSGTCIVDNATELFHIVRQENEITLGLIATVYSHKDAPTVPKPPSMYLELSALVPRKLCNRMFHGNDVGQYIISVKHPQDIRGLDHEGRMQQATDFNLLLEFLRENNLAAYLQPEQGRSACLIPMTGYGYAACVIYLPSEVLNDRIELIMKEEKELVEAEEALDEDLRVRDAMLKVLDEKAQNKPRRSSNIHARLRIIVGNVAGVHTVEIRRQFSVYGDVTIQGRSGAVLSLVMPHNEGYEAIRNLDSSLVEGKQIIVKEASNQLPTLHDMIRIDKPPGKSLYHFFTFIHLNILQLILLLFPPLFRRMFHTIYDDQGIYG